MRTRTGPYVEGVDYRWIEERLPVGPVAGVIQQIPLVGGIIHDYRDLARAAEADRFVFPDDPRFGKWRRREIVSPRGAQWNLSSAGFPGRRKDPAYAARGTRFHDMLYGLATRPSGMTRDAADYALLWILEEDGAPESYIRKVRFARRSGVFAWAWHRGIT